MLNFRLCSNKITEKALSEQTTVNILAPVQSVE